MDSQATTVLEQEPAGNQFQSAVASENPGQEVPVTQGRPDIDMPVAQGQEVPVAGVGAEFQNQGMEATQGQPEVAPAYGSQLQPVPEVAPGYGSQSQPVPEVAPGYVSQPQSAPASAGGSTRVCKSAPVSPTVWRKLSASGGSSLRQTREQWRETNECI